jgi:hypothetical protein
LTRDFVAIVATLGLLAAEVNVSDGSEVSSGAEQFELLRGVRGM